MLWVGGQKIHRTEYVPDNAAATRPYVGDDVVREFLTWDEARKFAADDTDYLGNLLGPQEIGNWVRFDSEGLNIVGEEHDYLTLDQITTTVGSTEFIYEQFAADTLPEGSKFKEAYLIENQALLQRFGVDLGGDLKLVGGESLLPKIADTVAELVPYFNKTKPMALLTAAAYLGQPDQRYVKIGWGWAKDLVGKADKTEAEQALVHEVTTYDAILNPFITGLPVNGFLGNALVEHQHQDKYEPLLNLCLAYVPVMIERAYSDPELTEEEQQRLQLLATDTTDEQQAMFGLWRNFYFAKAVERAAERNVRYAGMGDAHREWLEEKNRVPATANVHIVTRAYFAATIARNRKRRTG